MPKKKELKSPKGRAKEIAREIEAKVAQPEDPVARIEAMLGQLTSALLAKTPAEPEPTFAFDEAPNTEFENLQRQMGTDRAKNREWRDMEVLMSKIGHLEAFRDQAVHRLAQIEKFLASVRRR